MLKTPDPVKNVEVLASESLRALLGQVPTIRLLEIQRELPGTPAEADLVAHI